MKILFVGSVLPDAECLQNVICNAAGNKFQKRFITALSQATKNDIEIVSYEPARMVPAGSQVIFRRKRRRLEDGSAAQYVGFLNLPVLKQITQMLAMLSALLHWHAQHGDEERFVILFNVFAPHAMAVLAARKLRGGSAIAFVATFFFCHPRESGGPGQATER